jgi:hypothetical protein
MNLTIFSDGSISVDLTITGYSVAQTPTGTKVYKNHNNGFPFPKDLGPVVAMPKTRYTLSTLSGRVEFQADFLEIWNASSDAPVDEVLMREALSIDLHRILNYPDLLDKALFAELQKMRFIRSAPSYFVENSMNPELRLFVEVQAAKNSGVDYLIDFNTTEVAKVVYGQVAPCCDHPGARHPAVLDYYPILKRVLCTNCAIEEFGRRLGYLEPVAVEDDAK